MCVESLFLHLPSCCGTRSRIEFHGWMHSFDEYMLLFLLGEGCAVHFLLFLVNGGSWYCAFLNKHGK